MCFSPKPYTSSIGFMVVKKTACLPLLRLVPPGIYPFLIIEISSFPIPTRWRYSVNPFGIILQRRINSNTSRMSLDCSEIRSVSGGVRIQAILKPFLGSSSFCQKRNPIIDWPLRITIELFPFLLFEFYNKIFTFHCSVGFQSNILIMS